MTVNYVKKPEMTFIGFHTEIAPDEGYKKCPEFWDKEYAAKYARLWQAMKPETPVEAAIIANIVTGSRILLSPFLLFLSPYSVPFGVIYLLCGVTDVLDGFLARKLHTESKAGERLDSIADMVFAVVYAAKILPILHLPLWIWSWTVLIAVIKSVGIIIASKRERSFYIAHSAANKLTGLLIFILPMTIRLFDVKYGAAIVCTVATFAAIQEGHLIKHWGVFMQRK